MIALSYLPYLTVLFLATGMLILRIDVPKYGRMQMEKEKKAARWMGWCNVGLGAAVLGAHWLLKQMTL